ncbi:hypothetical protein ULMS_18180 [Patiriisocius marinistellae]|uniref:Uncharacterized protein n=1 Tax=Patiriisocius marinistellae TaxID=2494560 RepID=A0A5J4FW40_9FLAO|nr:hypothetical protein [Patiriisocius marinistellae]GEQ86310.1 hypothetical protein ULMS_18180 [Patiriisocius marinistellae]
MDLLLQKKKISSQPKNVTARVTSNQQLTSLGIQHINKLINEIQIDIDVVTFENSLKEDWMNFTDRTASIMNRKTFL